MPYYYEQLNNNMCSYTVGVAGLAVTQSLSSSGGSTPSLHTFRPFAINIK